MLNLTKSNGDVIYTNERIEILKVGGKYITEPVTLEEGNYAVTIFLIVNSENEVLYAVPKAGSPMANAVAHALPYNFSVSGDVPMNLNVEVLSLESQEPEAFGYTSFIINVRNGPTFQLAVFERRETGSLSLIEDQAFILNGYDTLRQFTLGAKTNTVQFVEDTTQVYTLIVLSPGYTRDLRKVSYTQLKAARDGKPLTVILEPAVTFVYYTTQFNGYYMRLNYSGNYGHSLLIDLGFPNYVGYPNVQLICGMNPL